MNVVTDYLVKWKGYRPEDNKWTAEKYLGNAKEAIAEYWAKKGGMSIDAMVVNNENTIAIIDAYYQREEDEPVRPKNNIWYYLIKVTSTQAEKGGKELQWSEGEWKVEDDLTSQKDLIEYYWWANAHNTKNEEVPNGDEY